MGLLDIKNSTTAKEPMRPPRRWGVMVAVMLSLLTGMLVYRIWLAHLPMVQRAFLWDYVKAYMGSHWTPHITKKVNVYDMRYNILKSIFGGKDLADMISTLLWIWGSISAALLVAGSTIDARVRRTLRVGIKLRGPSLLTVSEFNRKTKGDGIAFLLETKGAE